MNETTSGSLGSLLSQVSKTAAQAHQEARVKGVGNIELGKE
jgi:hypothetical protein